MSSYPLPKSSLFPRGIDHNRYKLNEVCDNHILFLTTFLLWQLLIKMINSILSSLIEQESYRDHKRTQQEVSDVLLPYLYYKYIVYASNK